MYFFKFQKPGNLEFNMLRRGELFFASVAELNDAHECRPRYVLSGTAQLWQRLASYILFEALVLSEFFNRISTDEAQALLNLGDPIGTQLKKRVGHRDLGLELLETLFHDFLSQEIKASPIANLSRPVLASTRKVICQLPSSIEERAYLASFTKNARNATMWGHYADAERGFVVVYKTDNDTLNVTSPIPILHGVRKLPDNSFSDYEIGTYCEDALKLKEVKYRKKPPKVNAFHRLIPKFLYSEEEDHYDVPALLLGEAKSKSEDLIGLVKFSDWRYEQEIRAFLPMFHEVTPDLRVLRTSPLNICGLIFGPRMTSENKQRAVICCHLMRESIEPKNHLPDFMFFQAVHEVDRFDFRITPVGILDGSYSKGQVPIKTVDKLDEVKVRVLSEASAEIASSGKTKRA